MTSLPLKFQHGESKIKIKRIFSNKIFIISFNLSKNFEKFHHNRHVNKKSPEKPKSHPKQQVIHCRIIFPNSRTFQPSLLPTRPNWGRTRPEAIPEVHGLCSSDLHTGSGSRTLQVLPPDPSDPRLGNCCVPSTYLGTYCVHVRHRFRSISKFFLWIVNVLMKAGFVNGKKMVNSIMWELVYYLFSAEKGFRNYFRFVLYLDYVFVVFVYISGENVLEAL